MRKQVVLSIVGCFLMLGVFAQREKALAYIDAYKDIAMQEMQRSGVPAAITLAQGLLESGYGESELCKKSNNHFGIKCKTEWTGEKTYHDDDEKGECFRVYPSAAESYKDHSDFLKSRPWYSFLFKLDPVDYEGWAKGLKKAGYATEKDYPQKLIKIIVDYNLQQYSLTAMNGNFAQKAALDTIPMQDAAIAAQNAQLLAQQNAVMVQTAEEEKDIDSLDATVVNPLVKKENNNISGSKYQEGVVMTINHAKAVFVKEGTSLLALANNHGISVSKLIAINDMEQYQDILQEDRIIFLEYKLKKGAKDFHVVEEGETLYSISQEEGVQLSSLLTYNKINKDKKPQKGDKIYLRPINTTTKKA